MKTPVIATTATANDRVVEDIKNQIGGNIYVQRGNLARESIHIQVIKLDTRAERMAWIKNNIVKIEGTGIIYCLTINDCNLLNSYLKNSGINSSVYHSRRDAQERRLVENQFMNNEIKVVVATTALGMGIDKPDISFVVHFQKPGNVVAYYQQIGRAGRGIDKAHAILLVGNEDDDINDYFIKSAFPTFSEMDSLIRLLSASNGMTKNEISSKLNYSMSRIDKCLKYLLVNGDIYKEKSYYYKSVKLWKPDLDISNQISEMRRKELARMNDFVGIDTCYMQFITRELNDTNNKICGICSNCSDDKFSEFVSREDVLEAISFIKSKHLIIKPRKKWPNGMCNQYGLKLSKLFAFEEGIALSNYADAGWGKLVVENKYYQGEFSAELLKAAAELLKDFIVKNNITAVTFIPSLRRPNLVKNFAEKLAKELGLDFVIAIKKVENRVEQKTLNNSYKQCENALKGFSVVEARNDNVLLVDDMVDSRWTFTVCAHKLAEKAWVKFILLPYLILLEQR